MRSAADDGGANTLRTIMGQVGNFDTVNFDPSIAGQTITLTRGAIPIPANNVTIDGQNNNITISGNNSSAIFTRFVIGGDLSSLYTTITNLSFINGKATAPNSPNGGAIAVVGNLTLDSDNFSSNVAQANGGAVYVAGDGAEYLAVYNSRFTSNTASGHGGAIATVGGDASDSMLLNNCGFTLNTSVMEGGAVYAPGNSANTLEIENRTVFNQNTVTGDGQNAYYGGGVYSTMQTTVSTGSHFLNNNGLNGGGGLYLGWAKDSSETSTISDTTFIGNTAVSGGGLYSYINDSQGTAAVSVTGSLFQNNGAVSGTTGLYGGGVFVNHNTSGSASASFTVTNSTFFQNGLGLSVEYGGGLALKTVNTGTGTNTLALTSLTVWQNMAATAGGGLWISVSGGAQGTPTVDNSIIAGNAVENPPDSGYDVFGTVLSQGYNLIGQTEGSDGWVGTDRKGNAAAPLDPGLDPAGPTFNGGYTFTIKLADRSQAYRNGDPGLINTKDQREFTRSSDRTKISIGAYDPDAVQQ